MKRTFTVEYGVVWLDESCRDPSSPSAVFRWEGDDAKVLDPRTAAVLALGEEVLANTKAGDSIMTLRPERYPELAAALAADAEAGR